MPIIRNYQTADFEQVIHIFDSNIPHFFAVAEKPLFVDFIKENDSPYFVIEENRQIIAAGGYAYDHREGREIVVFSWGMVEQSQHKKGFGKMLTLYRLQQIAKDARGLPLILETSQHTAVFYQKMGFEIITITKNGLSLGLDSVKMEKLF